MSVLIMTRILVTGSRDWDNEQVILDNLKFWYRKFKGKRPVILVSGNAKGADTIAENLWSKYVNPDWIERYPAKDFDHPLKRNDHMISLGANVCLGFLLPCYREGCMVENRFHFSHGGAYTVTNALAAGIEVHTYQDYTKPPF